MVSDASTDDQPRSNSVLAELDQLKALESTLSDLADRLDQEAVQKLRKGEVPDPQVLSDVATRVAAFWLCKEAITRSGVDLSGCTTLAAVILKVELAIASNDLASVRAAAKKTLTEVLRIAEQPGATIPPYIAELHTAARDLTPAFSEMNAGTSASDLLNRLKPFKAIADLVRDLDSTAVEAAEEPLQLVESAFGRRVALALMMGRLHLIDGTPVEPIVAANLPQPPVVETQLQERPDSTSAKHCAKKVEEIPLAPSAAHSTPASPATEGARVEPSVPRSPTQPPRTNGYLLQRSSVTATEAASQPEGESGSNKVRYAVWKMAHDDRCGLAFQLAIVGHAMNDMPSSEPASLFKAMALAPHVRPAFTEGFYAYISAVNELDPLAITTTNGLSPVDDLAHRFALLAATLRPALLAPRCNATAVVGQLSPIDVQFKAVGAIRSSVQKFSETGLQLDAAVLKGVREHADWESRLSGHVRQLLQLLAQERCATLQYAPATEVWRRWNDERGLVGSLVSDLTMGSGKHSAIRARLETAIGDWSNERDVGKWLAKEDQKLRGPTAGRKPIEGGAKLNFMSRVEYFVSQLKAWLNHLESEPGRLDNHSQLKADEVRTAIQAALPDARNELRTLSNEHPADVVLTSAAALFDRTLVQIQELFDQGVEESLTPRSIANILHQELLSDPNMPINLDDWSLRIPSPKSIDYETELSTITDSLLTISAVPLSIDRAFERALKAKRHDRTQLLIESLNDEEVDSDDYAKRREEHLLHCRANLRRQITSAQDAIEQAVCDGLLSADERSELQGIADVDPDRITNFPVAEEELRSVEERLKAKSTERAKSVEQEYDLLKSELRHTLSDRNRQLIESAIDNQEFQTAGEYVALARKGEALVIPQVAQLDTFNAFGGFASQFATTMESLQPRSIVDAIGNGLAIGPFQPLAGSADHRKQTARCLDQWLLLKDSRDSKEQTIEALKAILEGLGFREISIESFGSHKTDNLWDAVVTTLPLLRRSTYVVPYFGSEAKGHYHLIGLFGQPNAPAIVRAVGNVKDDVARIVLYFGRMNDRLRRECAREAWQAKSKFVVIDDAAFFFAMTHGEDPLTTLFDCCLPYSYSTPYASTASLVPPEMFYGREEERKRVADRTDTNLLFGGRQLGKSALLRDIEQSEHDPSRGRIVKWIDLKNAGIGVNRDAIEIWAVIGSELGKMDVLQGRSHSAQKVIEGIKIWLHHEKRGSILLLLDEADAFLASDGKPAKGGQAFPEVALLKGLMDESDRRFKVVFAGLHNVQRTARDPNSPIGHLGNPICVGPLLDNGGWRRALDLINEPMGRMGFVQHPADASVWMRMLSYTNWYPSLIQVFCTHLLEYLHNKKSYDFTTSPPYEVTLDDIKAVYRNPRLQEEIRQKFELTLDLDPRYRLIALLISLECYETPDAKHHGVNVDWVRREAMKWWAAGFANSDSDHSAFRTLLDEMIGLGILRSIDEGRYTLRSANVLRLLGNEGRITQDLDDISSQPGPIQECNKTFRRVLDKDDLWIRSPLTGHQEATLARATDGVAVVFGCRLSGLDRVTNGLEAMKQTGYVVEVRVAPPLSTVGQFHDELEKALKSLTNQRNTGVAVFVIGDDSQWTTEWVKFANQKLSKRYAKHLHIRVVFLADAIRCWELSQDENFDSLKVAEISLQPWHDSFFDPWASDVGLPRNLLASQLQQATEGWPDLINTFIELMARKQLGWQQQLPEVYPVWLAKNVSDLGFPAEAWRCLHDITRLDQVRNEDLPALEELFPGVASRVLRWANNLHLTRLTSDGLVVDPLIIRLAKSVPPT